MPPESLSQPAQTNPLRESVAAASLALLLYWGLRFFPYLGPACLPAAALPFVRLASRRGIVRTLLVLVPASALSVAIAISQHYGARGSIVEGIVFLAVPGSCAVAAGLSRRKSPSLAFLVLSAAGLAAIAALWLAVPDASSRIESEFRPQADKWLESSRAGGADAETIRTVEAAIEMTGRLIRGFAPAILAGFWICVAAIGFFLGRRLGEEPHTFSEFRLPAACAALFVAAGAACALGTGVLRRVAIDILTPLGILYFLTGISIITAFARRLIRSVWLRSGLYVAASWFPVSVATAGLGLFDWYFNFRERAEKRERKSNP